MEGLASISARTSLERLPRPIIDFGAIGTRLAVESPTKT
jgi:hypothetical protein